MMAFRCAGEGVYMCGLWFVSNGVAVETWLVLWSGMELYGWYGCRVVVARCGTGVRL